MPRDQRCSRCQEPIRSALSVSAPDGDDWFHPACWHDQQAQLQVDYRSRVERTGLAALLEPYLVALPATGRRR